MELKIKIRENLRINRGISMPEEGFEPTRDYASRWILSPVRLPISPLRHSGAPKIISYPPEVNKLPSAYSRHETYIGHSLILGRATWKQNRTTMGLKSNRKKGGNKLFYILHTEEI